jgi:hypothetical protein
VSKYFTQLVHRPGSADGVRSALELSLPCPAHVSTDSLQGGYDEWTHAEVFETITTESGEHLVSIPMDSSKSLVQWRHANGDALPWEYVWNPVFTARGICFNAVPQPFPQSTDDILEIRNSTSEAVELQLVAFPAFAGRLLSRTYNQIGFR